MVGTEIPVDGGGGGGETITVLKCYTATKLILREDGQWCKPF